MSKVVSVDINYSSNSGPHTASISTIAGPATNAVTIKKPASIGDVQGEGVEELCISNAKVDQPIRFGGTDSARLNSILRHYIIRKISTATDARVTKVNYSLEDSISAEYLDNILVLVRGISSSPVQSAGQNNNYFYEGAVFDGSELPAAAKIGGSTNTTFNNESAQYDKNTKILFIGNTRSVFTPNFSNNDEKLEFVYERGSEVSKASFHPPIEAFNGNSAAFIDEILIPQRSSVSLRYGYTIKQFKNAVEDKIGISLKGLDDLDVPPAEELHRLDTFVNFTGTLRNCISSIAALLGLYWFVDLSNAGGKQVTFVNRKSVRYYNDQIETVNDGSENLITAQTKTEEGLGPNIVLSFSGSTDPPEPVSIRTVFKSSSSDLVRTNFYRVRLSDPLVGFSNDKINLVAVQRFFDFFMLSKKTSQDQFNELFFAYKLAFPNASVGSIYPGDGFATDKETDWKSIKRDLILNNSQVRVKGLNDNSRVYQMRSGADRNSEPEDPSDFFTFCSAFYDVLGRVFISRKFGPDVDNSRAITSSTMSIHGPFHQNTFLSELGVGIIDRFLALAELGEFNSVRNRKVSWLTSLVPQSITGTGEYFYIGEKNTPPTIKGVDVESDEEQGIDFLLSRLQALSTHVPSDWLPTLFISAVDIKEQMLNFFNSSNTHFERVQFNEILSAFVDVAKEQTEEEPAGGNPNQEPEATPELNWNHSLYKVSASKQTSPRKSQLIQFGGTIKDVRALIRNVGEVVEAYPNQISISKTYYGLVIPRITPTLDSISINVGEDGIDTTITRSTKQLLPVDQNIIIDRERQAFSPSRFNPFSAAQKNALKL